MRLANSLGTTLRQTGASGLSLLAVAAAAAGEATRSYALTRAGERPQPVVAVDNVCAWPNLTVLRDGTIVAAIHNQPSHLKRPADVECWAREAGEGPWVKRGTPIPRDNERTARGNVAAGLAQNGDLVVIASGWSDPVAETRGTILPSLVSRSADGGRTWEINAKAFPAKWPEGARTAASPDGCLVPFGDILTARDGTLRVGLYGGAPGATFVYCSRDDGRTWGEPVALNPAVVIHEPALIHLGEGKWLAAARLNGLDLYTSDDDARTWARAQQLSGPQQHPGHFVKLRDGRVLLSYGNRVAPTGVDVRLSDDSGKTWGQAFRVADFEGDGGYPSSVQLPSGEVLTAYYAQRLAGQNRYHMGVVVWDPAIAPSHAPGER